MFNQEPVTEIRDIPSVQQVVTTDALQADEATIAASITQVQEPTTRWLPKQKAEVAAKTKLVWQPKCQTPAKQTLNETHKKKLNRQRRKRTSRMFGFQKIRLE